MPPLLSSQVRLGDPDGAAEGPAPGIGAELAARATIYVDEDPDGVTYRRYQGYEPLIEALRDKGVGDAAMQSRADVWGIGVPGTESWDYRKVYDLARQHGVGDLKKDRSEFEAGVAARPGYQQRRAQVERGGRWWLELPLGVVQSFQPEYGPLPALGLPSKTILGAAAREAAINTLFEGVEIARTKEARDTLGNPITVGEGAARLGTAAIGGALFGGGGKALIDAAPKVGGAVRGRFETLIADNWDKLPAPLREKWGSAANVDGTALPDIFEAIVGRDNMSLDEKGAIALLRREAEIDAANPFRPDGAGIEAHNAAIARNVERVAAEIQGMRAPRSVAAAAGDSTAMASGTVPTPTSGARSTIKAKIGRAESPSDTAKNPLSSATGRYQFVSGTWLSYYKRRYGSQGLTDAQILAKRTDGNVQDVLMDDLLADNARFLQGEGQPETAGNLYLTHFAGQGGARKLFRADPRASALDVLGADVVRANPFLKGMTAGDVIGWASRKMDEAAPAIGGGRSAADAIDPEAAVRADLDARGSQLEAERAALDADAAARSADDDIAIEAGRFADDAPAAPMPELQRELFPDEMSWRLAQAAVDAEARGLPEPLMTRQSMWIDARDRLIEAKEGDVPGALYHPDVGPIDVKWGEAPAGAKQGFGLAKIVEKHPEVLDDLPAILGDMTVTSRTANRIQLESADHKAAVRLEWDGKEQTWLLTAFRKDGNAPPQRRTDVPGRDARDGSPTREAAGDIAENGGAGNAGARAVRDAAAGDVPMARLWGDPAAPRDAGGLTAAERASLDYDEPGLKDFVDPAGEGNRLDLDGSVHDLRAAIDAEDPLAGVAFATRDGIDEMPADALAAIDAEEKALAALRACL